MLKVHHNAKLNQLLIDLGRSLLQYVGQSSTWSSRSERTIEQRVLQFVAIQADHVVFLSDLLMHRRWTIDFGQYPANYTDLHFLSLKYLLKIIVVNQRAVVAALDEFLHTCVDDHEAVTLIEEILASERQITDQLQSLSGVGSGAT